MVKGNWVGYSPKSKSKIVLYEGQLRSKNIPKLWIEISVVSSSKLKRINLY